MAYGKKTAAKPPKKKKGKADIMQAIGGVPNNGMTIKSFMPDSNVYSKKGKK